MNSQSQEWVEQAERISAIVPARDEASCIAAVVRGLFKLRNKDGAPLIYEVVVADNGSSDGTGQIARRCGARVVEVAQAGYGRACWEAAQTSIGGILLFVDGDGAADPIEAVALLGALAQGADLAIGVRQRIEPGAMTSSQRWGNAFACALIRLLWRTPAADLGPYRAIRRDAFAALHMRDRHYGWTVEMQVRAHRIGLRVAHCPVTWRTRLGGQSKISGTLRGVLGAGCGILGMIAKLWLHELKRPASETQHFHSPARPI